jgi:hypothetical protein
MVARASGDELVTSSRSSDAVVVATVRQAPAPIVPIASDVRAALAEAMPDDRHDVLVDVVRRAIAHVLRIPDPGLIPRRQPLLELGFDSLMAVELRNVLRHGLSLEQRLPATVLFDHPTVEAIATYLDALLSDSPRPASEVEDRRPQSHDHSSIPLEAAALADLSEDEVEAMFVTRKR